MTNVTGAFSLLGIFEKLNSEDELVSCQWEAPAEQDKMWVLSF